MINKQNQKEINEKVLGEGLGQICLTAPIRWDFGEIASDAITRLQSLGSESFILDLSSCGTLSGIGLIQLFKLAHLIKNEDLPAAAWGVDDYSFEVLTKIGLTEVLPIFRSRDNALRALKKEQNFKQAKNKLNPICNPTEWCNRWEPVVRSELPPGENGLNVLDRNIQLPNEGCGKLVLKRYRLRLGTHDENFSALVDILKGSLSDLWPEGNKIHFGPDGVIPGAVGSILLTLPGRMPLATGVRVIYRGDDSFTFATLRGHMAAGFIDFSIKNDERGLHMDITSLARTGDPAFNIGFNIFGHIQQEQFWHETLERAAKKFEVPSIIETSKEIVDKSPGRCSPFGLVKNAAALTLAMSITSPIRTIFRRTKEQVHPDA